MGVLARESLLDTSELSVGENTSRFEYLAKQLAGSVASYDFPECSDKLQRGYNKAFFSLCFLAESVALGQQEVPSALEVDQVEDWFFGRAVLACGFGQRSEAQPAAHTISDSLTDAHYA